jgi:uncharacterized membrane protein YdbT with pleckstrin-like domain
MSVDFQKDEQEISSKKPHFMMLLGHVFLTIIFMLFWLPILIFKIIQLNKTRYILTNKRIIYMGGVFNKFSKESPLDKVQNVSIYQSLLGRMFNYGNVMLQTASELGMTVFRCIPDPNEFKNKIVNQIEIASETEVDKKAKALTEAIKEDKKDKDLITYNDQKECPQCAEFVKKAAKICRYCNYKF